MSPNESDISKCPVMGGANSTNTGTAANQRWWPNQLKLSILRQNSKKSDPMGDGFDYAAEFASLDVADVKADLE